MMTSIVAFHNGAVVHLKDSDGEELAQQVKSWLKVMPCTDELWLLPAFAFKRLHESFGQIKVRREWEAFRSAVRRAKGAMNAQDYLFQKGGVRCCN